MADPTPANDRRDWIVRMWREVAQDYCSHKDGAMSCAKCRGVVSDVVDLLAARAAK